MINSMTGFASGAVELGSKRINLEIRSVNHRFLDIQFKMPDDLRYLESQLREIIGRVVYRGKVECRIQIQPLDNAQAQLNVNQELVDELAALGGSWCEKHPGLAALSVADILRFPGVLVSRQEDETEFADAVKQLTERVLIDFVATREREGMKLQDYIIERIDAMVKVVDGISLLFPQLLHSYLDKLRSRVQEAVINVDEDRLKQEFTLYIQKADVDEEFSRLRSHMDEVRWIVTSQKGSVGKRLDFLMQELNREANTLGSKAIAAECTQVSVELKVIIEQMREQVQNIE